MSTAKLTALDRQVLGALIMEPDAPMERSTAASLATRTGISEADVTQTLEHLETLELVHRDTDGPLEAEFWIALTAGADVLESEKSDAGLGDPHAAG